MMPEAYQASGAYSSFGWKQRHNLSSKDWEDALELIKKLYITDKQTLQDTMRVMEKQHGFKATRKMYKTKLGQWGLGKYRPRNSCPRQSPRIKGLGRAFASAGEDDGHDARSRDDGHEISSPKVGIRGTADYRSRPAVVNFTEEYMSPTSTIHCVEMVSRIINVYFDSWQEDPEGLSEEFSNSSSWYEQTANIAALFSCADTGRAWESLESACAVADRLMAHPYNDILQSVIAIFLRQWWLKFSPIRVILLRYLHDLAAIRLGERHPLKVMLYYLIDEEVLVGAAESALHIAIHAAEKRIASNATKQIGPLHRKRWSLKHSLCCLLIDRKEYKSAKGRVDLLLDESIQTYRNGHPLTRSVLLRKGDLLEGLDECDEAERQYREAIELAKRCYDSPFPDNVGIEAFARLARLHVKRGDLSAARDLCDRALKSLRTPVSEQSSSLRIKIALKDMLEETLHATVPAQQTAGDLGKGQ